MKLTSFSIHSKPSAKITKPSTFSDEPAEKIDDAPQFVTEFDSSVPLTLKPKTVTIPRPENTCTPESMMKNIGLPTDDLQFEASGVDEFGKTDGEYGLNLRSRFNGDEKTDRSKVNPGKSYVESLWDQKNLEEMEKLADEDDVDTYREVPVENFAAAVLASYGWSEGKGIGRNAKKDVPVYEHPRRKGGGFGAMVDPEVQRRIRRGKLFGNGVGSQRQGDEMKNTAEQLKRDSIAQEESGREDKSRNNQVDHVQRRVSERQDTEQRKGKESDSGYKYRRDANHNEMRIEKNPTESGRNEKNGRTELVGRSRGGGNNDDGSFGRHDNKKDWNGDEKKAGKRVQEADRNDEVASRDYKEKRIKNKSEENVELDVDYEDKSERRKSDKTDVRSSHRKNRPGYKSRGDDQSSRNKDDKVHNRKVEDDKREKDTRREDQSIDERDGLRSDVSWLISHIRVRVISKEFRGGKFYLKKGEVVDVIQPRRCVVSMDGSKEIIEGVKQDVLETVLPKRGGSAIILYGKYKGVYGKLVEKDTEEETALVQDAKTSKSISVVLDQIAEYVGDPRSIGY